MKIGLCRRLATRMNDINIGITPSSSSTTEMVTGGTCCRGGCREGWKCGCGQG